MRSREERKRKEEERMSGYYLTGDLCNLVRACYGHESIPMRSYKNASILERKLEELQAKLSIEIDCFNNIFRELELEIKDIECQTTS
ncbi:hypothetical protein ACH5RR_023037 [Cinchona calisaya]|uniref:Uncharacterized protein n=1 Tax=Cinchona calisaya TaxID=153742 RepID=A0ABD2ZCY1_9GENT